MLLASRAGGTRGVWTRASCCPIYVVYLSRVCYPLGMTPTQWPADWQRGILELCVLRIIGDGPTYGYDIAARLAAAGLGEVKGGTLYPLLKRLEQAGLVDVEWRPGDGGPGRKFYELNDAGRKRRDALVEVWQHFSRAVTAHVSPTRKDH